MLEEALQVLAGIDLREIEAEIEDKEVRQYFSELAIHEDYVGSVERFHPTEYKEHLLMDDNVFEKDISKFPEKYRIIAKIVLRDFKRRGEAIMKCGKKK
jgi:hypothetical protein